jgi:hypothetical protein
MKKALCYQCRNVRSKVLTFARRLPDQPFSVAEGITRGLGDAPRADQRRMLCVIYLTFRLAGVL